SLFPTNPSLGLFLFSPLVPAADNRPALALLTTVQLLLGLSWMTRRAPRAGESRARARAVAALRFLAGSVAVFLAAFEALRLAIPYDPWAEEARAWRHWAVRNGHGPSWWRGAIAFYTPMPVAEWKRKTTNWLSNLINALEADRAADAGAHDAGVLSSIPLGPRAVLKAGEADTYTEIYESLCAKNGLRAHALLAGALADVSELNKAARLDALLEDEGHVHLDADYSRPNIQLGTHTMDTDADFEMVWANFEPWDELFQETDFDVRMIPRWR
ncbi:i-AAA protease complex subunit Mgr1, partial [Metschnikowia bicuspidata var. bicuspidata NRRL YB-4993]